MQVRSNSFIPQGGDLTDPPNIRKFKEEAQKIFISHLPELQSAYIKYTQAGERAAEARAKAAEARAGAAQARAEAAQAHVEADQAGERAAQNQVKIDTSKKNLQGFAKQKESLLIKMFYSIFYAKKPVPTEEVDKIDDYVKDSLSMEKVEKKSYAKLYSMKGVIRYLKDHSEVTTCDFRHLKNEVYDIDTLATYLSQANCPIKAIAIKKAISSEAKTSLSKAIEKRAFKVQYAD